MERGRILYIVVPCYNEEEVLQETGRRLIEKMGRLFEDGSISGESRIMFVDDGSKDRTWSLIEELHKKSSLITGLKLSRNRGHQNALLAGLMTARECADIAISMDADLQDDIDAIDRFLDEYYTGHDIVYGVRSKRETDTFFKRFTAEGFYRLMGALGVNIMFNHADYRLMSRRALDALSEFKEVNLFLRGMVPLIGFSSSIVTYERRERFAGKSKYPLKKMLSFAVDGITSFSVRPLRIIAPLGAVIFCASLIACICLLAAKLSGRAVSGSAAIVSSVWMAAGIQLLCVGVIGEYVGKIYSEVKARPRYIIEKHIK